MINVDSLTNLLSTKKSEDNYWTLAFRSLHFISEDQLINIVGRDWLNAFYLILKKDIDILALEVYGDDYPDFKKFKEDRKKGTTERMKEKPNRTWYPRFISVEDRIEVLREVKGISAGGKIFNLLIDRHTHIHRLKDYAKNRHNFIVGKGWWAKNIDQNSVSNQ